MKIEMGFGCISAAVEAYKLSWPPERDFSEVSPMIEPIAEKVFGHVEDIDQTEIAVFEIVKQAGKENLPLVVVAARWFVKHRMV